MLLPPPHRPGHQASSHAAANYRPPLKPSKLRNPSYRALLHAKARPGDVDLVDRAFAIPLRAGKATQSARTSARHSEG